MLRLKGEPALDQVRPLLSEASRATTEPLNAETPIEAFNLFGISGSPTRSRCGVSKSVNECSVANHEVTSP